MTNNGDVLAVGPDSSGVLFARRNLLETGWDVPVFLEQGAATNSTRAKPTNATSPG